MTIFRQLFYLLTFSPRHSVLTRSYPGACSPSTETQVASRDSPRQFAQVCPAGWTGFVLVVGPLVQLYKLSKLSGVDGLTGGIFMYADLSEMIRGPSLPR